MVNFLSTEFHDLGEFPDQVKPLAFKAKAEGIRILLPAKTGPIGGSYRGFFDSKLLQDGQSDRLREIARMQAAFPIGKEIMCLGYLHRVVAVTPRLTKAMCLHGVPPPEERHEIRLISDIRIKRRVTVAELSR
jgi:hypothetical protein